MPIFKVTCTVSFPVQCQSADGARARAAGYLRNEVDQGTRPDSVEVVEITSLQGLEYGWRAAIPWGNDDDDTIATLLKGQ